MKLEIGKFYYDTGNRLGLKVSDNPLEYCGPETHTSQGQTKTFHDFYDGVTRLHHWIDPKQMQPVETSNGH